MQDFRLPEPIPEDLACVENITSTNPVVIREGKDYDVTTLAEAVEDMVPKFTLAQEEIYNNVGSS